MKFSSHFKSALAATTIALASAHAQAPGDVRVALVIGNGSYASAPPLVNPANDAKAMGETLRGLGFTVVELRDGSKSQMAAAIAKVRDALKGKQGVGMLYYAGHGLQMDARNYMVPVDAKMSKAGDVAPQTVDVGGVVEAFKAAGNRMNILVLDACRDNPFGGITSGKGLAPLDAPSGTFLAYATAPGNVAEDGDVKSGNGLYTQYLLQELKKPQASIENVFKRVRFAVRRASNNRQIPWESTSLEDDFQFNDGRIAPIVKPTAQHLLAEFSQEKQDWDRIKDSTSRDDFFDFVQKYPGGTLTEAAHARLNVLAKTNLLVQGAGADGKEQAYVTAKFRLGDEYSTRETVESSGTPSMAYTISSRVVRVSKDEIAVENFTQIPGESRPSAQTFLYDGEGGWKGISGLLGMTPPRYFLPPGLLQVGRNWKVGFETEFFGPMRATMGQRTSTGSGRIVARETITVPAGTFQAFKVEQESITTSGNARLGKVRGTFWFVPDMPTAIKQETETEVEVAGKIQSSKSRRELMRFVRGA